MANEVSFLENITHLVRAPNRPTEQKIEKNPNVSNVTDELQFCLFHFNVN